MKVMQGRPLVFVDVETTGGRPDSGRILEIGAMRVENGQLVGSLNQVLDPEEPVPIWITNLTGIEPGETAGQPRFQELLPQVNELFDGALFIAHNVNFDYSFFTEEFRRAGLPFAMDKLCTVRLSRSLYPAERTHRLDKVIERHGYAVARRHRAFDDAEVLYKFYHDNLARLGEEAFYPLAERLVQRAKPTLAI